MTERTRKHGTITAYTTGACRCDECKRAWSLYQGERRAQMKAEGKKRTRRVPCTACGTVVEKFYEAASRRSVCSQRCRYFLRWGKFPPSKELVHVGPAPSVWREAPPVEVTVVTSPRWWGVITNGPCSWCAETFTSTGHDAKYCSRKCARQSAEAKRGARFQISPVLRRAIYERDHWTCQLCQSPVDPDADPWSDWFPSLDHIVPQSHTLIPDHSPANLRTAHRWCNAIRGDGTHYPNFFEEVPHAAQKHVQPARCGT